MYLNESIINLEKNASGPDTLLINYTKYLERNDINSI